MIKVDRTVEPEPNVLKDQAGLGQLERAAARKHYAAYRKKTKVTRRTLRSGKNYEFTAYKHADVKQSLDRLFHGKCAYCEAEYRVVITGDVEHYRPKGRITLKTGKRKWPGYYWLAVSWSNLLPVCKRCNSLNTDLDHHSQQSCVTGKADAFPLIDEAKRAVFEADHSKEEPLLLDPCEDDPALHLKFEEKDGHQAVIAALTERGNTSIKVLGLNRATLVLARKKHLDAMTAAMADLQFAYDQLAGASNDPSRLRILDYIQLKTRQLTDFMRTDRPFTALARKEIPPFLNSLKLATTPQGTP